MAGSNDLIARNSQALRGTPREVFNFYLFSCNAIVSLSGVAKGFDEGYYISSSRVTHDAHQQCRQHCFCRRHGSFQKNILGLRIRPICIHQRLDRINCHGRRIVRPPFCRYHRLHKVMKSADPDLSAPGSILVRDAAASSNYSPLSTLPASLGRPSAMVLLGACTAHTSLPASGLVAQPWYPVCIYQK